MQRIIELLKQSKRPLLIGGHGVILAHAEEEFMRLVHAMGIPVQNTWNSIDLIPHNEPLYFGRANVFGPRFANKIIQEADLIIGIGAHFGMQHVGYNYKEFAPKAKKVVIGWEHSECIDPDIFIQMDAKEFIIKFLFEIVKRESYWGEHPEWVQWCLNTMAKYPVIERPQPHDDIDPYEFCDKLSREMTDDMDMVSCSSGTAFTVMHQVFRVKKGQRFLSAKGLSSMGYGLPSAIGSCIASGRITVCTEGDGGLQMVLHCLSTIRHLNLPIKIFVFNNGGYQSIYNTTTGYFKEAQGCRNKEHFLFPDILSIAATYDIAYLRIDSIEDPILGLELAYPCIYEVRLPLDYKPLPKLKSKMVDGKMVSGALDEMLPEVI
jgi:acetolactate synthase I/II/III large subunit